jgi:hypothetical protein
LKCQKLIWKDIVPKRLVYVGDSSDDIRLCLTENISESGLMPKYATLTHCWGNKSMSLMTTRENVNEMLRSIPFDFLDKTFQDAIMICRKLDFKHLWIDCLCILQGDASDWETEATNMGSIYGSCGLNIVAADSPDGEREKSTAKNFN